MCEVFMVTPGRFKTKSGVMDCRSGCNKSFPTWLPVLLALNWGRGGRFQDEIIITSNTRKTGGNNLNDV